MGELRLRVLMFWPVSVKNEGADLKHEGSVLLPKPMLRAVACGQGVKKASEGGGCWGSGQCQPGRGLLPGAARSEIRQTEGKAAAARGWGERGRPGLVIRF